MWQICVDFVVEKGLYSDLIAAVVIIASLGMVLSFYWKISASVISFGNVAIINI